MEYTADPFGFPMVWVQETGAWVHCLPVTYVQLDMFRERTGKIDIFRKRTGKVDGKGDQPKSIKDLEAHNYTRAFATGVDPADAQKLARHFEDMTGEQFRLPSHTEWHAAYRALAARSFPSPERRRDMALRPGRDELSEIMECCRDRARTLMDRLHQILAGSVQDQVRFKLKLADLMLFRLGVMEWVRLHPADHLACADDYPYAGMGLPASHSWANLADPELRAPVRLRQNQPTPPFGFRLWRNAFPEHDHA